MLLDCIHELSWVYCIISFVAFLLRFISFIAAAYVINKYRAKMAWSLISTILMGETWNENFTHQNVLWAKAEEERYSEIILTIQVNARWSILNHVDVNEIVKNLIWSHLGHST